MKKLIIHTCCAICCAGLVEKFKDEFDILIFFSNSNIYPEKEYQKRKESVKKLVKIYNLQFQEDNYNYSSWKKKIKGLEKEKEGGKRCSICFLSRMLETADFAKKNNIDFFTTTLSVSPYKNKLLIDNIGKEISSFFDLNYLEIDKDLWKECRRISSENDFYHQKYCGCFFSKK